MAPGFRPEEVPVLRRDAGLPVVPVASLDAASLRRRFASPPAWRPEFEVERRVDARAPAAASVLVAVVLREEPTVLLTRRAEHLNDHPGQISFPGGRAEAGDADAAATALREAYEEIGLEPGHVEVLGRMPTYSTGTGFVVTPVVGLVQPGFVLKTDPFEVAEVFEVPLAWLMNPANHQHHAVDIGGVRREFLSLPWRTSNAEGEPRHYFIWGATAGMLRNLYRFFVA